MRSQARLLVARSKASVCALACGRPGLRRLQIFLLCLVILPSLSGCLLMSGRESVREITRRSGVERISFVSSDTNGAWVEQSIPVAERDIQLEVTVTTWLGEGELALEFLSGDNDDTAFAISAAQTTPTASGGLVRTSATGELRYRIKTLDAYDGSYTITFKPLPPPTPTPTITPTSVPTRTPTATPTIATTPTP